MLKINFRSISYLLIILISCNSFSNTTNKVIIADSTVNELARTKEKPADTIAKSETFLLLQGKWQHIDDTTNFLVFEGNEMREIAEGMADWDVEEFVLANKCLNDSDKNSKENLEEDSYISCKKSDLCWYILGVDKNTLSLSYMARGNKLTYNRVK
ncbi:MAG: hypothetical protein CFE21_03465 [Bacteroidetes bacterium B1(2017)]|nr:MAG: hypothetical protein CFE21_03465 [Bacteroidetes bacterium B1(2017)]